MDRPKPRIVVYQPGKVGSLTVVHALEAVGLEVYHSHALCQLAPLEKTVHETLADPDAENATGTISGIVSSQRIFEEFRAYPPDAEPWRFILIVRSPIRRNISGFFQVIEEFIPDVRSRYLSGDLAIDEVHESFLTNELIRQSSNVWFDHQVRPLLHVDVYEEPFDFTTRSQTFDGYKSRGVIVRMEDFSGSVTSVLSDFLDRKVQLQTKVNTYDQKWYSGLYKEFVQTICMPDEYIEYTLGSKFARHFYTLGELEAERRHWIRQRKQSNPVSIV